MTIGYRGMANVSRITKVNLKNARNVKMDNQKGQMMPVTGDLHVACKAVRLACALCRGSQRKLQSKETHSKEDTSPVTVADLGAQAVVSWALQNLGDAGNPVRDTISLVAEEDSEFLRSEEGSVIRSRVVELVNDTLGSIGISNLSEKEVLEAIDQGKSKGGSDRRHWVLDPIDGTRGFVGNRQYAIALALLDKGEPVVGVLGCPNLSLTSEHLDARTEESSDSGSGSTTTSSSSSASSSGYLFLAEKSKGAYAIGIDSSGPLERISVDEVDPGEAVYMESVESRHSDHAFARKVAEQAGILIEPLRVDSQAKYGVIAAGRASAFMRFPDESYKEKIWDHAAGAIIMTEAGGLVTDATGAPLDFTKGRILNNASGIIAAPPKLHGNLIDAIKYLRE